jgi:hypothetical protein
MVLRLGLRSNFAKENRFFLRILLMTVGSAVASILQTSQDTKLGMKRLSEFSIGMVVWRSIGKLVKI